MFPNLHHSSKSSQPNQLDSLLPRMPMIFSFLSISPPPPPFLFSFTKNYISLAIFPTCSTLAKFTAESTGFFAAKDLALFLSFSLQFFSFFLLLKIDLWILKLGPKTTLSSATFPNLQHSCKSSQPNQPDSLQLRMPNWCRSILWLRS